MSFTIRGGFVFRDEGDGCLTSKYVNNHSDPFVEAAKLSKPDEKNPGRFYGTYDTVWLERRAGNTRSVPATLTIGRHQNGNYQLVWQIIGEASPAFEGVGMIVDALLVGGYWSVD